MKHQSADPSAESELPVAGSEAPGPLRGLRVVELGDEQAEYCGLVLAGLGAEVVKVEPPGGVASRRIGPFYEDQPDPERSVHFWAYNRGKRSIVLDLSGGNDADTLARLLGSADVLLDSTPGSLLGGLGLHQEALLVDYPRLVHARMSPFGDTGPWADYRGSDLVHLALGGVTMNCGYDPDPFGRYDLPPIAPQVWHAFHIAGEQLAMGVVAALISRIRSGRGQYVSCAIHEAVAKNTELDLMSWVMVRQPLFRQTCRHATATINNSMLATAKDGRLMLMIALGARDRRHLRPFLDRYGLAEGLEDETRADDVGVRAIPGAGSSSVSDAGFVQRLVSRFRYEDIPWQEAQGAGLLWSPIRKPHENALDEHWLTRGTFTDVKHPELGRSLRYPTSKWLSTRGSWKPGRRAPRLDEDRREVLAAVTTPTSTPTLSSARWVSEPVISRHGKPFPLQGVRILDFTWFLASSGATRFLAALGADVIKVEWKEHPDSGRATLVPEGGRIAARGRHWPDFQLVGPDDRRTVQQQECRQTWDLSERRAPQGTGDCQGARGPLPHRGRGILSRRSRALGFWL